jgi:hypothetical protein
MSRPVPNCRIAREYACGSGDLPRENGLATLPPLDGSRQQILLPKRGQFEWYETFRSRNRHAMT